MTLYKLISPYLTPQDKGYRQIIVTDEKTNDLIVSKVFANTINLTTKEFLALDISDSKNVCSMIMISEVFGKLDFSYCDKILKKAFLLLMDSGLFAIDAYPIDKITKKEFKDFLLLPEIVSKNNIISNRTLVSALEKHFELIDFKDARSKDQANSYLFRFIKPAKVSNFNHMSGNENGLNKIDVFKAFKKFRTKKPDNRIFDISSDVLRNSLNGRYIPANPKLLLISPSAEFIESLCEFLNPIAVIIYGYKERKKIQFSKALTKITYAGKLENIDAELDNSADFIFVGDLYGELTSTRYFKFINNVVRIRNRNGCVLIKYTSIENSPPTSLNKEWALDYVQWAKTRNSLIKKSPILIKGENYFFISQPSPYGISIRQKKGAGDIEGALLKFENYLDRNLFTIGEGAMVVKVFSGEDYFKALTIFADKFGVLSAVRLRLISAKHTEMPLIDIVECLEKLISNSDKYKVIIFDIIGEFCRHSKDYEKAQDYWIKSYNQAINNLDNKELSNSLARKIKLYSLCEISCSAAKSVTEERQFKINKPNNSIIIAESNVDRESLDLLINRFKVTTVFTPSFRGDIDMSSVATFRPLIGLIPENSKFNKSSHKYAKTVSEKIIQSLIANVNGSLKGWLKTHQESVALSIEDFLARHLLVLEAYAEATKQNPKADIILASRGLGYFDKSLSLLLSRLNHKTVWLHADDAQSDLSAYESLFQSHMPKDKGIEINENDLAVNSWFDELSKIYTENVSDYISSQKLNMAEACFVMGNLSNRYFRESVVTVAAALHQKEQTSIIIDSSTTRNLRTDMSSLWNDCHINEEIAESIPIVGMRRPALTNPAIIKGTADFKSRVQMIVEDLPLEYKGSPAAHAFSYLIGNILTRDIPILLYNSIFAEKLLSAAQHSSLTTTSTREPHDLIIANIFKRQDIPITLVQAVETLRHPRYKKPVANHITVIDQAAFDTYADYFNIPEKDITITGSPQAQINYNPERVEAINELLDSHGLALKPPLRILFTTRVGNLDKTLEALEAVVQQMVKYRGTQLIVKAHPREDKLRLAAYGKLLKKYKIGGPLNILDKGTAETLMMVSHCVISFPSNVVRVAAEIGIPVLEYMPDEAVDLKILNSGKIEPLRARTLDELRVQLESLFSVSYNKNHLNKSEIALKQTLNGISNVVIDQDRSSSSESFGPPSININTNTYSSLSFKEISALAKRQVDRLGKRFADVRLLERALDLARDPEDYASILYNVVHYAPPTYQAAEFFAALSMNAAGAEDYSEAISQLASPKLARYAAQLKHADISLGAYTILALAQCCLAVGDVDDALDWYDVGITQNSKVPLHARIENEKEALRLLQWDGQNETENYLSEARRIIVVAERGTEVKIYTSVLPSDSVIDVYFDGKAGETLGILGKINSKSSRDVLDFRAPELKTIVHEANSLSSLITAHTLKHLKKSKYSAWLKEIRPAIEMELRGGLITQLRRYGALKKAINKPYDAIVLACNTPSFLGLVSDSLSDIDIPTFVIGASKSPARRRAFGAARKRGLAISREKQEAMLQALKKAETTKALKEFDNILDKVSPRLSQRLDKQALIAITSWRISTIKDGCLSLIENLPAEIPITIFDTSRYIPDAKRFLSDISRFAKQTGQDIRPFSAQYHNRLNLDLRELKNSTLAQSIFASVKATKNGKRLSHALQLGIWNQIGTLLYKTLPMLYDLHIQVSTACKQSEEISLIVLPGRDAESLTAQNAVQKLGVATIDVQTAYFERGYTYTAPNGDIVTAMDEWSKNTFTEWFNILEEKVHVCGTSRFDRFSKLRMSRPPMLESSKLRPHICLATQPIDSGIIKKMLTCLNDLYLNEIDFDCTVKLHPRQSETIIDEIKVLAGDLYAAGRLTITKKGDLAQILFISDLVITVFSNVAIEAALMDCPVLIVNFTDEDIPIPFMEFGIAEEARTQEGFEALAARMLYDEAFRKTLKEKRHNYFKTHSSQWRGEAGQKTAALIQKNMRKPLMQ